MTARTPEPPDDAKGTPPDVDDTDQRADFPDPGEVDEDAGPLPDEDDEGDEDEYDEDYVPEDEDARLPADDPDA